MNVIELLVLLVLAGALFFVSLSKRHILVFLIVLSASLVGTTIPLVDHIAALVRWVSIFLLFVVVIVQRRFAVAPGVLLFWGYVLLGFVFLLDAVSFSWQFQRGLLLLAVSVAIPLGYGNEKYSFLKLCLVSISLAATIYCLFNFMFLPAHLSEGERFSGSALGAPAFAMFLGGLLPFAFWGIWGAHNKFVRGASCLGFLSGLIMLISSGQRTGTIGGMVGLAPLLLTVMRQKKVGKFLLITGFALSLGYILLQHSSVELIDFLSRRYDVDSGLSGRESYWAEAFSEIAKNPLLGRGIGAAENVVNDSFHNAYLEIWFNTGFVGLLLFITSQVYFVGRTIYLKRISKDPETRSVLALALGYMLGFAAMCVFESTGAGASNLNLILYLFLMGLISTDRVTTNTMQRTGPNTGDVIAEGLFGREAIQKHD